LEENPKGNVKVILLRSNPASSKYFVKARTKVVMVEKEAVQET
jgi:hypothetical protein